MVIIAFSGGNGEVALNFARKTNFMIAQVNSPALICAIIIVVRSV